MMNLKDIWQLRLMFPELTEAQFRVLALYSFGYDNNTISDILNCTPNAVKMTLRKIKEKLDIERLESARAIYNSRIFTAFVISVTTKDSQETK